MADRPILFSAPMVQALLAGRKTQTRRIAKITAVMGNRVPVYPPEELIELEDGEFRDGVMHYLSTAALSGPYDIGFAVGDRLWVKEAIEKANGEAIGYRATGDWLPNTPWQWKPNNLPSMYMPRRLSRLTLTVMDVRVQRLQGISEEDAIAEGIEFRDGCWGNWEPDGTMKCGGSPDPVEAYRCLWLNINGTGSWEANPWIVAVSFTCERRNIYA